MSKWREKLWILSDKLTRHNIQTESYSKKNIKCPKTKGHDLIEKVQKYFIFKFQNTGIKSQMLQKDKLNSHKELGIRMSLDFLAAISSNFGRKLFLIWFLLHSVKLSIKYGDTIMTSSYMPGLILHLSWNPFLQETERVYPNKMKWKIKKNENRDLTSRKQSM